MDLQLTDISLWSSDSEKPLSFKIVFVFPEVTCQEPEYKRSRRIWIPFWLLELPQKLTKDI